MKIRDKILKGIAALMTVAMLCSCSNNENNSTSEATSDTVDTTPTGYQYEQELNIIDDNYRNYYQIFVYSFCDSDGDGIGDLKGITSKLDYIEEMGFNGIWLSPIMPSTTYHKYDVKDYYDIDSQYGTMDDFDELIKECDAHGIKLIIDLVLNHTSSQNEWFKSAAAALKADPCGAAEDEDCLAENEVCPTHNKYIGYYNFSTEIGSGYSKLAGTDYYYECPFWSQMPDLNLENEDVRREIEAIVDFWLDKGVGGFRLDAVKEFVSGNVSKNVEILTWFMGYCKSVDPDCYVVGEEWDGYSTYVKYYESGIDSIFGYEFATQSGLIQKTIINSNYGVQNFVNAIATVEEGITAANPNAIDAPFISNHDNARDAGFLRYDETNIKAAAGLLMTMTGSPFVYYGQEIGLTGSGKDENLRAPMIWDAEGTNQTDGPPSMEEQENKFPSVEEQLEDPDSILNYYKRAARIRNENPAIARGKTVVLDVDGNDYAAVQRTYDGETITIVYNYSDEAYDFTDASLDLANKHIRGYLTQLSDEQVTLSDGTLSVPAYGIAFLADGAEG